LGEFEHCDAIEGPQLLTRAGFNPAKKKPVGQKDDLSVSGQNGSIQHCSLQLRPLRGTVK
jgi:hypothetical protein